MLIGDSTQLRRLEKLGFRPEEFDEIFARSGGPGGQNVNKVSTAVTLRHRGSGLAVTAQDSRSQYRNRQLALERLISLLERRREDERIAKRAARERVRRQHSPRPAGLKREIRESKQRRAAVKRTRQRVAPLD
jgi:protein subunit release factor B